MMKIKMRYAISSFEETWIKVCYKFFEKHGMYDWYLIDKDRAFREMMIDSKGTLNPTQLRNKIDDLYKSVGV